MKPAWDKLIAEYKGEGVIADVDCTKEQALCSTAGVQGYPTIKYGTVSDLQAYNGGRDFDSLMKFANENLGPSCGPANLDLCDADQKTAIDAAMAKDAATLEAEIKAGDEAITKAGTDFGAAVKKLQSEYEGLQKAKDEKIAEVKASGLGLLKTVRAHKAGAGKKEL